MKTKTVIKNNQIFLFSFMDDPERIVIYFKDSNQPDGYSYLGSRQLRHKTFDRFEREINAYLR